jgi:glycosyltransferase involved in cell wall biosynthesis
VQLREESSSSGDRTEAPLEATAMHVVPVTVILPVRNGAGLIGEALQSVERQSWRPQEIIIMDGDSSDDSEAVARSFKNTLFFKHPEANALERRNKAVARASHPYIAFLDADDLWPEQRVELQLKRLLANEELEIVTGKMQQFRVGPSREIILQGGPVASQLPTVALMRRTAFWRVGAFSPQWKVGAFVEWCARANEAGLKREAIPDTVLLRRLHENNWGRTVEAPMQSYLDVVHHILQRRRAAGRVLA